MYTDISEKETAIARTQEEQVHIDRINNLLEEASPEEKRAIVVLAIANIDLATTTPSYVFAYMTFNCTDLVQEAYRHIRHIGENKKSAIAIDILDELFTPGEDDDDDDDEDDDDEEDAYYKELEGQDDIAAALMEGNLNEAFRVATILEREVAEAIASH